MSRMSPHVQALRAEAKALSEQAQLACERGDAAVGKKAVEEARSMATCAAMLALMSDAKLNAADALEQAERDLETRTHG